ncbi:hypothetical protein Ddc_00465 [Ditylenchus destructor]|nr:hypothetical protein Ddc_00465 [Ditylenchus destructor]
MDFSGTSPTMPEYISTQLAKMCSTLSVGTHQERGRQEGPLKSEAGTTWRQGRELSDGKGRALPPFTQDNAPQAAQSIFILKTRLWIAAAISQKSCTTLGYYFIEQPGHPPLFTHISVSKKPLLNNNVKLGKLSTWHM